MPEPVGITPVPDDPAARKAFILAHTRPLAPAHTPELRLYQADEVTPLWQLTEEDLGAMGVPPPFWAFAWAGGQALARYLLDTPETVAGCRVLDFATGSGLVAVAAMKAGAMSVLACDIDPYCAAAVPLNAALNGVEVTFTGENLLDEPPPPLDVLLAGDVCYEKPMAERVLAWMAQARAQGTRVLIGDPGRTYFPREGLTQLARYQVPTTRDLEDYEIKNCAVWALP
ncbi:MAG: class I SAM-dependent methyltransferase [Asticcacaulis sp.]